jgi:pimeloyl-ACP methyl ester carboxylesterase
MLIGTIALATALHLVPVGSWIHSNPAVSSAHAASTAGGPKSIVVGTQLLHRCQATEPGYCGNLIVPLNWLDLRQGTIGIHYELIPPRSGVAKHTIVAEEGGPGYASMGTAASYVPLFAPMLGNHNLLMMDERGTGGSAAIDCKPLQAFVADYARPAYLRVARDCGDQLDRTYRAGGAYVRASDLFDTSQSVRDLAAILASLQQGPVDLYGDSYGSFFAQVFAARYPQLLRSVVLDSTYATIHQNPFDAYGEAEIRFAYDAVCQRSLACSADAPGNSDERIHRLAERLDAAPLVTTTRTPRGTSVRIRVDSPELETLLAAGGYDYETYRNLDAALRAWLERGDDVPLARLFEFTLYGPAFYAYGYKEFSAGMGLADECTVYANPFSLLSSIPQRRREYAQATAALPPHFGYPVSNADALNATDEAYDECLTWPRPTLDDPIITNHPPLVPATLPVLIVSGDIDTVTSPGDNEQAFRQLGPSARLVTIPNEGHTPALGGPYLYDPYHCAARIVRAFVTDPSASLDTSCTARIPEIRTVGVFPTVLADQPPAAPLRGNQADADELRLAALAVEALGDVIWNAGYLNDEYLPNCGPGYCGVGLRGGTYRASNDLTRITLQRIAYSNDTTVSGSAAVLGTAFIGAPGEVRARGIHAADDSGRLALSLDIAWSQFQVHALARIDGVTRAGRAIHAIVPAP